MTNALRWPPAVSMKPARLEVPVMVPVLACTLFFIMGAVTLRRQARVPSTWELGSNLMKSSSASFV